MKVQEFRNVISHAWNNFASLRGCLVTERPNEAKRLRRTLAELKQAECRTAKPRDLEQKKEAIEQAEKYMADCGI